MTHLKEYYTQPSTPASQYTLVESQRVGSDARSELLQRRRDLLGALQTVLEAEGKAVPEMVHGFRLTSAGDMLLRYLNAALNNGGLSACIETAQFLQTVRTSADAVQFFTLRPEAVKPIYEDVQHKLLDSWRQLEAAETDASYATLDYLERLSPMLSTELLNEAVSRFGRR